MSSSVRIIQVFVIGFAAILYSSPTRGQWPAGKLVDSIACQADPAQTYAFYIPAGHGDIALPVIYFFDPHGDGALPLAKYRSLADAFGFLLIGSNNSKNGNDWTVTGNIWDRLYRDTRERWKIDPDRIYTCGFSGGAKVAGYIAIMYPGIRGVIANGAGLPDGASAGDFSFSFTAIAGEGDMNMTDLLGFNAELDHTRTKHRVLLFDGIHEWAPSGTMREALTGLQFDAMRIGRLPADQPAIDRYATAHKKKISSDEQSGQWIKAFRECQFSIGLLDGWAAASWFKEQAAAITANPRYLRQRQTQNDLLVREKDTKTEYARHFQDGDPGYWNAIIRDLQAGAAGRTAESPMQRRLLAYLSLAFYSLSNRLIGAGDNGPARHYVELYKKADPANSEAWYFSAILDVREGHVRSAEIDLHQAATCGFKDAHRMKTQPEFQNLNLKGL